MEKFGENTKVHFIGVCGAGMSAVAKLLKDRGCIISGSDANLYPPISDLIEGYKIKASTPYSPQNIPDDVDFIVIGGSKRLNVENNEEVVEAYKRNVPIFSFPEVLNIFTEGKNNIVCAGSSGKTTSTAIITHCLEVANKNPSYFMGGVRVGKNDNAKLNNGEDFVLEGDEYPVSNTDKRAKFLFYNTKELLVTSMVHDHFNIFPIQEEYNQPFIELVNSMNNEGRCVVNVDNENTEVLLGKHKNIVTYGFKNADWVLDNIEDRDGKMYFTIKHKDFSFDLETVLFGEHNAVNILGCAAILVGKHMSVDVFKEGIKTFMGVRNRLEKINQSDKIRIYEGFGSSKEKVKSAINAFKNREGRLFVIFEPHALSWGIEGYFSSETNLFEHVDKLYIYSEEMSLPKDFVSMGLESCSKDYILEDIKNNAKNGDIVLTLSSGAIGGLRPALVEYIDSI